MSLSICLLSENSGLSYLCVSCSLVFPLALSCLIAIGQFKELCFSVDVYWCHSSSTSSFRTSIFVRQTSVGWLALLSPLRIELPYYGLSWVWSSVSWDVCVRRAWVFAHVQAGMHACVCLQYYSFSYIFSFPFEMGILYVGTSLGWWNFESGLALIRPFLEPFQNGGALFLVLDSAQFCITLVSGQLQFILPGILA